MSIYDQWLKVRDNIERACARSGRSPDEITVVAVTKYMSPEQMQEVFKAGLEHIGESKAQDALEKWEQLGDKGTWHFIGHLQSNKVKYVIDKFRYIHSLDRLSLAREIERRAARHGVRMPCFIQVNVSGETSKHGLHPDEVERFVEHLAEFNHIVPIGLMTMAPYVEDPEQTRPVFSRLKELQILLQDRKYDHAPLTELSMGMSNDYPIAVEEGATYLRLGSCLMGR
ncbi:pyridoxal phosphate enzyme (YggS family) [Caldalkalibacillus uzonensis]|uniref:Pyridoxal phosphate homeostasis protein n=1 Tax=Caldalkalibacillus uzonensis TaxID=353224 RepID=A0ABU0CS33_9BACI|nr:YggS family pyridoxal phosphate-dependent enzyme [Caldalkalibacillus uzonensis]MDQ0339238.1 pyridoxal phosphate enzyme (YggS family) [Caldalkalibacillus uzonensis]